MAAGWDHTCAVTTEGGVKCWGWNYHGQLGDGTTTNSAAPVDVTGLGSGVRALAAGRSHTCALTTEGGVKCWGRNSLGQLGNGVWGSSPSSRSTTPVDVVRLRSGVVAIAAGFRHTCALTTRGGVKCWGDNSQGQLGVEKTSHFSTPNPTPLDVKGLTRGVAAVTAGGFHTCALTTEGRVKCWGNNSRGQLGDDTTTDHTIPMDVCATGTKAPCGKAKNNILTGVAAVAAGEFHTCALTTAGGVKCWGHNGYGQLGDGTIKQRTTPVDVVGLGSGVVALAAGGHHTCALTTEGGLQCWGDNREGQLGDGTGGGAGDFSTTPVGVVGLGSGVAAVAAGGHHTCALTTEGGLQCWGRNYLGQLGAETTQSCPFLSKPCSTTPADVVELGPKLSGDVDGNGGTDAIDALSLLGIVAGLQPLPDSIDVADVNCDGVVDPTDALLILRGIAGLPFSQPAGCPPIGLTPI